ncbi:hypothetical protein ERJ75_001366000 [Trypanosoma vivax]|nr:hypothetical protein ERJ75_001366000 [Trypanosoma vivax]
MSAADESFRREEVNGDTSGIFSIQIEPEPDVVRPPTYQLEDKVGCVLMDGHVPPPDMKLSVFLKRIGLDIVPNGTNQCGLSSWTQRSAFRMKGTASCFERGGIHVVRTSLRGRAVPVAHGIHVVQQWKEKRDDICSCEHEGVRDRIWNVAVGRLNAAVAVVGLESDADREARVVSARIKAPGQLGIGEIIARGCFGSLAVIQGR